MRVKIGVCLQHTNALWRYFHKEIYISVISYKKLLFIINNYNYKTVYYISILKMNIFKMIFIKSCNTHRDASNIFINHL